MKNFLKNRVVEGMETSRSVEWASTGVAVFMVVNRHESAPGVSSLILHTRG